MFLSNYHKKNRSKLLYLFGSINLRWSVDNLFLNTLPKDNIDNDLAGYTSRPDRNLKMLIDIWNELIISKNENLKLLVTENDYSYEKSIIQKV